MTNRTIIKILAALSLSCCIPLLILFAVFIVMGIMQGLWVTTAKVAFVEFVLVLGSVCCIAELTSNDV